MVHDLHHEQALVDRGASTGITMVDIGYFKAVNDKYGHQTGDAVLRQMAEDCRPLSGPTTGFIVMAAKSS
jgi:diguanylate cyclase (GGDEF)-like protein